MYIKSTHSHSHNTPTHVYVRTHAHACTYAYTYMYMHTYTDTLAHNAICINNDKIYIIIIISEFGGAPDLLFLGVLCCNASLSVNNVIYVELPFEKNVSMC